MTGLGRSRSSMSVSSLPRCRLVILRPKIVASFVGTRLARRRGGVDRRLPALSGRKEGRQGLEPFLAAPLEVPRGERIGERLEARRITAAEKRVAAQAEREAVGVQPIRPPLMLVEAHPRGKRKVRAEADEHAAPVSVMEIEVVLDDPASLVFEVPSVVLPDRHQNAGGLASFEDHNDLVGLGPSEVRLNEFIASSRWGVEDGRVPLRRASVYPPRREPVAETLRGRRPTPPTGRGPGRSRRPARSASPAPRRVGGARTGAGYSRCFRRPVAASTAAHTDTPGGANGAA